MVRWSIWRSDLKQYAPKLFENQPIPQETQPEKKEAQNEVQAVETPLISQEVRLLAAISHASVLFPNIGLFVPIGIYLTQKKKPSYTRLSILTGFNLAIRYVSFQHVSIILHGRFNFHPCFANFCYTE